jgi:diguanylate cyclase (GGDEF)-like protein
MARTISETAPPDAVAMRYRGNQFAVVVEAEEDVIAQARKLQQALIDIDLSGNIGESSLELSVSVGISVFPDTARAGNDLVNAAHEKVFEARADGGNRIYLAEHT